MQRQFRAAAFVLLLFFVPIAFATGPVKPEPAPAPPTVKQTQQQAQQQAQAQQQRQTAQAAAAAAATAAPVQTVDARTSSQASSSSGGNSLEVSEFNPRQSPGIAQGSFAIQGCGAAANAGGSNVGGAAFLGVGFTTPQCYDFMLAQAYAAAGAWAAACEVLNASPAGKRAARRGVRLPECAAPAAPSMPTPPPAVPTEITVRVDDGGKACEDRVDRAFKQCVAK